MTRSAILFGNDTLTLECARMWRDRGHEIAVVVTRHAPLVQWAEGEGLRVEAPGRDLAARLDGVAVDWVLCVAYLSLVPEDVLALARDGGVNFHDGPLPSHAGLNAPVWALLDGARSHGITWHRMTPGVDEGAILLQSMFDIAPDETALTLNSRCFAAALESFPALIDLLEAGETEGQPQDMARRSHHARADRPEAAGMLDFSRGSAELAAFARALDHGEYWNPLTCPKIAHEGRVWLVGKADSIEGRGAPGEVLAVEDGAMRVATATGALRLTGLRDAWGGAVDELPPVGATLDPADPEAGAALARIAPHEGYWRARLGDMPAAQPALLSPPGGEVQTAEWQFAGLDEDALTALAALFLARLCDDNPVQIAWRGEALVDLDRPGIVAPWVPLPVSAGEGTLDTLAQTLAEHRLRRAARLGFAPDLLARDPALADARPCVALRTDDRTEPLPGMAATLAVKGDRLHLAACCGAEVFDLLRDRVEALREVDRATPLDAIPRIGPAERAQIVHGWNRTGKPYDMLTMHAAFEAQAARTPDATAVIFEAEHLSYGALDARANRIAQVLRGMGVRRGALVGLSLPRGSDMIAGALGILKAGGAYVPMDPAYPAERLALYAADSGAEVIVTQSGLDLPGAVARLDLDTDPRLAEAPDTAPGSEVGPGDLAYMIYTSGSTGRPKGVMVEHRNVANFFAGMDDRIPPEGGKTWLAVTSLNFDISVLELFYTLARGYTVVLSGDEARALAASGIGPVTGPGTGRGGKGMEFSLFYWGNDGGPGRDKYRLLLEGAKFADDHGFCAVWTPERHFHAFGGPYPNPSVTGAAVAAVTRNLSVRAGSCVAPLHHTARIAEEWAVIDNLTNGRAALAIASGWQPDDFVLRPENSPPDNKPAMMRAIEDLRRLWRGEEVPFARADGTMHKVVTQPRPVSTDVPIWVTTAGNPETWKEAGRIGANVLTHLLGQSVAEVGEKIALYHAALREAGHDPARFKVTLMLHSYLADTREQAREVAREPMKEYLRSAAGLIKQYAWAFPAFKRPEGVDNAFQLDLGSLSEDELEGILDFAFERYFNDSGLFGTVEDALARVDEVRAIGVNEIACLIDYGIDEDVVLKGLRPLARVLAEANREVAPAEDDFSIAAQIERHGVSHLQCTPSMARMLLMSDEARAALGRVRHLMLGGEALPAALVRDLRAVTDARIENMYGPTETTIWSSTGRVEEVEGVADLGTPIANTQLYVLDAALAPVPIGNAGELWIGGDGVTRGYHGRPDLTGDRFHADPFREGGRIYGTGDLVRRRADGGLDFLGRADTQVKLRGYRIELGEIEAAAEALDGITEAVVIAREDQPGDLRLVAYLRGPQVEEARIKAALAERLPAHMVPAHVVRMDHFPLTPNRKVDRKALPAPNQAPASAAPARTAPASPGKAVTVAEAQTRIAAIWARILGVSDIGAGSNFFDLGGHSLLAVQAHRDIKAELGVAISITDIFRHPTLGALAEKVGTPMAAVADAAPAAVAENSRAEARRDAMSRRRALRAARRR